MSNRFELQCPSLHNQPARRTFDSDPNQGRFLARVATPERRRRSLRTQVLIRRFRSEWKRSRLRKMAHHKSAGNSGREDCRQISAGHLTAESAYRIIIRLWSPRFHGARPGSTNRGFHDQIDVTAQSDHTSRTGSLPLDPRHDRHDRRDHTQQRVRSPRSLLRPPRAERETPSSVGRSEAPNVLPSAPPARSSKPEGTSS